MADLVELSHYYNLADQLIEKASKQDIAETARLLAVNLVHYKMKYGELTGYFAGPILLDPTSSFL